MLPGIIRPRRGDAVVMTEPSPASDVPFTAVAAVGAIPRGEGRVFEVSGRLVAVFYDGERYWALDDLCPHMGASLGSGPMVDGVVTCPWHAWRFRLCDGAWCDNPKLKVEVFDVRVEGESIEVRVPPAKPVELPHS
jgi:nitrite reductase (NADH) small subunit/3-phenylpropionate/trans-cinnamate dioxygenase ferredoxin subunit